MLPAAQHAPAEYTRRRSRIVHPVLYFTPALVVDVDQVEGVDVAGYDAVVVVSLGIDRSGVKAKWKRTK